jgi:hypothetical protein
MKSVKHFLLFLSCSRLKRPKSAGGDVSGIKLLDADGKKKAWIKAHHDKANTFRNIQYAELVLCIYSVFL